LYQKYIAIDFKNAQVNITAKNTFDKAYYRLLTTKCVRALYLLRALTMFTPLPCRLSTYI